MSKFTLVALFSILAVGAFTGCGSDETIDEEARWRNYRQDQEIARLREENRRKPRTVVVREKKENEIFEPVRNTPSTINDPLYGQD